MGRGLSPLQRWMLVTADANKTADEAAGEDRVHLYLSEVPAGFYGWMPTRRTYGGPREAVDRSYVRAIPASWHYSPTAIGIREYQRHQRGEPRRRPPRAARPPRHHGPGLGVQVARTAAHDGRHRRRGGYR